MKENPTGVVKANYLSSGVSNIAFWLEPLFKVDEIHHSFKTSEVMSKIKIMIPILQVQKPDY